MTASRQLLRNRPRRTLMLRRALRAGLVMALGYAVVVTVGWGEEDRPVRVGLVDGAAWVASEATGTLTLIDGHTTEVAARVAVRPPGNDLVAVQAGTTGYALDRTAATVTRVDPATLDTQGPEQVLGHDTTGPVTALATADDLYVLDPSRGRLAVTDANDVGRTRRQPATVGGPVTSSVVDDTGRLWLLTSSTGSTGSAADATDLLWFDGAQRGGRRSLGLQQHDADLLAIDGKPALVDMSHQTVRLIGDDGSLSAQVCLDVAPDDRSVRLGGSTRAGRLYAASGATGDLHVSDLRTGACDYTISVTAPDHELGRPEDAAGQVFVPDHTTGTVAVVDPATGEVHHTDPLVDPGTAFELFGEDGIVFYNDPGSERAGIVHADGSFSAVDKYDPADREAASPEDPDPAPLATPGAEEATPPAPADPTTQPPESPSPTPATGPDTTPPNSPSSNPTGTGPPGTDTPTTGGSPPRPTPGGTEPPGQGPPPTDPPPPQPPAVSPISTNATTYFAGQEAQLSADVTGTFTDCEWTVGATPVDCTTTPGPAGTARLTGTSALPLPGDTAVTDVTFTLTVTWTEGTVEQHTTVVLKDLRPQWSHKWPDEYIGAVWITVHTPDPTPRTITIAWGPWRRPIDHSGTEPVTYWFRKRDGADKTNVSAIIQVNPTANVTFGAGSTPPPGSIDVNAGWIHT